MPRNKCHECGGTRFSDTEHDEKLVVGGRTYRSVWPAQRCDACGDATFDGLYLHAFELGVARVIATNGAQRGDEFAFMRKAIGMPAADLAELLDVARETISRWENDKQPLERRAVAILSDLVADHLEGRTRTLDRLRMLSDPPKLAKTVPIEIDAALKKAAAPR